MKRFSNVTCSLLLAAFVTLGLSACAEGEGNLNSDTTAVGTDTAMTGQQDGMGQQGDMQTGGQTGGAMTASFDEWDGDGDGDLTEEEVTTGVWESWDADASGDLTESEFNDGVNQFFGNDYQYSWSDWDANGDGTLTESEFNEGWDQYGTDRFDEWDADGDGTLTESEFNNANIGNGTVGGQGGLGGQDGQGGQGGGM